MLVESEPVNTDEVVHDIPKDVLTDAPQADVEACLMFRGESPK